MSSTILSNFFGVLAQTLSIYSFLLIVRVLLTWFPNIDWSSNQLLSSLASITDPYLNAFRGFFPPIGSIDISPILAFLLLNVVESVVNSFRLTAITGGGFQF